MQKKFNPTARLASLDGLLETIIPAFLNPPPSRETLREWFDGARIPRFKHVHPKCPGSLSREDWFVESTDNKQFHMRKRPIEEISVVTILGW